jgi:hypothetical protein
MVAVHSAEKYGYKEKNFHGLFLTMSVLDVYYKVLFWMMIMMVLNQVSNLTIITQKVSRDGLFPGEFLCVIINNIIQIKYFSTFWHLIFAHTEKDHFPCLILRNVPLIYNARLCVGSSNMFHHHLMESCYSLITHYHIQVLGITRRKGYLDLGLGN